MTEGEAAMIVRKEILRAEAAGDTFRVWEIKMAINAQYFSFSKIVEKFKLI